MLIGRYGEGDLIDWADERFLWASISQRNFDVAEIVELVDGRVTAIKEDEMRAAALHFLQALQKEFSASRDLNYLLDKSMMQKCINIRAQLQSLHGPMPSCFERLQQKLNDQLAPLQAAQQESRYAMAQGLSSRGADFLWLRATFGAFANEVAQDEALCQRLHRLSRDKNSVDGTDAVIKHNINGMTYCVSALKSGSGTQPCYELTTKMTQGISKTLMKLTDNMSYDVASNQQAIHHTNSKRGLFATDVLRIHAAEENPFISRVELQEWLHGCPLSQLRLGDLKSILTIVIKTMQLVVDNHENNITMTDLTLDNLWLTATGPVVVADKKSLYKLHDAAVNPDVSARDYPFTATLSYISSSKEAGALFEIPSRYKPYQICNQSLAISIVRLLDQCKSPEPTASMACIDDIDAVFKEKLEQKGISVTERIALEKLKAYVCVLGSLHSDKLTASHILANLQGMLDALTQEGEVLDAPADLTTPSI
jgi:hypothetical protein